MTWANRLRMWCGVLVVLAVVAALTLLLNQRERTASSVNATVRVTEYQVGSDYGGVMVEKFVESDSVVRRGQRLFTVSSFALQKDLANGMEPVSTDAYTLDVRTGLVTYKASSDGLLRNLTARQGSYVPGGQPLAVIAEKDTASVVAQFRLEPIDYGRIVAGGRADVELPDRQILRGTVVGVSVETVDGTAHATVSVDVPGLRREENAAFAQPGAPVTVALTLRDDGVLAGPTDTLLQWLRRVGVR